ncbi:MAG: DNA polymerase III subunit gamma/tau [Planctomycetes bacterium]|nr:DNA polymerase III subunit gamma/tau [Planctomycetota bacterium]
MSYLVLARKYRPETFAKVVGQEPIARTLQNALKTGRLAHAYLFTGPRGVGKTSMARILAKALLCESGPTPEPCLTCARCKGVAAGHELDVLEIDGASNRGIENIRDLRESVRYAATGGKYKVYIVDEVHQITQDAFNAFLKTLEEPPPNVIFVFATTEPRKVPETIRSRCQEFEFRRIPDAAIAGHVRDVCAGENFTLASGLDAAIARRARGGLRDALSLLDQLAAFGAGTIGHEAFQELTGYLAPERVRELFDALVERDAARAFAWLDDALRHGTAGADLLDQWLEHLRALLHARVGSTRPPELAGIAPGSLEAQAQSFDETQLLGAMQVVIEARRTLREIEDERLVLEMALVELARIRELEELRDAIARGGAGPTATTAPPSTPRPAPRAAPAAPVPPSATPSLAPPPASHRPPLASAVPPPAPRAASSLPVPATPAAPAAPAALSALSAPPPAASVAAPPPSAAPQPPVVPPAVVPPPVAPPAPIAPARPFAVGGGGAAAVPALEPSPLGAPARFEQLRAAVQKEAPSLASLLDTVVPVREEGATLWVRGKPGAPAPALPNARLDEATRRLGKKLFGQAWLVRADVVVERPPSDGPTPAQSLLKQLTARFGGETVSGGGEVRA